ncbi:MAG: porin family protein [Methylococcaceae bacterium]|nr:porin family protein [Methylococcaceae bacterium]
MYVKTCTMFLMATVATPATAETQPALNNTTWTGFYAGVSLGAIINESHLNADHNNGINTFLESSYNEQLDSTDVLPGIHAGYNHQLSSGLVLGGEADFTYPDSTGEFTSSLQDDDVNNFDKFTVKNRLQGAVRGRIGYALANFLPYVTVGVSFADTGLRYENELGDKYQKNSVQAGWILGGGLEYAFCKNFSLRTEYLYTDYGSPVSMAIPNVGDGNDGYDPNGFAKADLVSHSVRAALNFRF